MSKGIVVDASVLVAALHKEDSQHAEGEHLVREAEKPFLVPECIVFETTAALIARANKTIANGFLKDIAFSNRDFHTVPSTPELVIAAVRTFASIDKKLSLADCVLLVLSSNYKILTFDRVLAKAISELRSGS